MGAFAELSSGTVGPETVRLVYEMVASVARIRRFPPPAGSNRWDDAAVQDVAHDFIDRNGMERLRKLGLKATDETSFERLLTRSIGNHLSDEARQTAKGRVSRAITHRLGAMESIESRGGRGTGALWMIQGGDPNGVAPPLEDLIASSFRLTGIIAARTVAEPQPGKPLIDPTSLEAVLNHALTLASCPLDHTMLLDIVVARFPAVVEDRELPLTDRSLVAVPSEHQDRTVINDAADEVWAQLNHRERLALPAVAGDRTVRDLADELGMSKSTVGRAKDAAEAVLAAALPAPDDSAAVAAELLRRSAALADGTEPAPSPSSFDTGGEP